MPLTKSAKRALKSSKRKAVVNSAIIKKLEMLVRDARKSKTADKIKKAVSYSDVASKKKAIHKNKASRIKSALSKLQIKAVKKTKKAK